MGRLIINIWDADITDKEALEHVLEVVEGGKAENEHYHWFTRFASGLVVSTNRKRDAGSADTFTVHRGK